MTCQSSCVSLENFKNHTIGKPMKDLIFILDQGTTHHKITVFDENGRVVDSFTKHAPELKGHADGLGFCPKELGTVSNDLIAAVLKKYPNRFLGFGLANQGESVLAWHRETHEPLSQVISWQCQGASDFLKEKKSFYQTIQEKSGLIPNPYFSAAKLGKLFYSNARVQKAGEAKELALGTLDSWMIWLWTNGQHFVTDPTTACRTQLFETFKGQWSQHLMDVFGLKESYFAKILPNSKFHIVCNHGPFADQPLPLLASYCDQPASLLGHGGRDQTVLKASFGTGVFVDLSIPRGVRAKNLLVSLLHAEGDQSAEMRYYLEGGVLSFASAIEWYEKNWKISRDDVLNKLENKPACYVLPAFSGLGAPHFQSGFKTVFGKVGLENTSLDMAIALTQSLVFRVVEIIDEMKLSHALPEALFVDGGFSQSQSLMQYLANVLQRPVVVQDYPEITSIGVLQGVMQNLGKPHVEELHELENIREVIEPTSQKAHSHYQKWKEETRKILGHLES